MAGNAERALPGGGAPVLLFRAAIRALSARRQSRFAHENPCVRFRLLLTRRSRTGIRRSRRGAARDAAIVATTALTGTLGQELAGSHTDLAPALAPAGRAAAFDSKVSHWILVGVWGELIRDNQIVEIRRREPPGVEFERKLVSGRGAHDKPSVDQIAVGTGSASLSERGVSERARKRGSSALPSVGLVIPAQVAQPAQCIGARTQSGELDFTIDRDPGRTQSVHATGKLCPSLRKLIRHIELPHRVAR